MVMIAVTLVKQLSHHAMPTPIKRRWSSHSAQIKLPVYLYWYLHASGTPIADASHPPPPPPARIPSRQGGGGEGLARFMALPALER